MEYTINEYTLIVLLRQTSICQDFFMTESKREITADYELLGHLLREFRENASVTQIEMAEALGENQPWISRHESGEYRIDLVQAFDFLSVLNVPLSKFSAKFESELKKLRGE